MTNILDRLRDTYTRQEWASDAIAVQDAMMEIERLAAEVERLQGNIRAEALDMLHGTPCAQIRWQQERETLESEINRLRAGGCARDQSTTQYCVEAAHKAAYIAKMDTKLERWRMALVNIAQGKGDPVAVACKALEADNE